VTGPVEPTPTQSEPPARTSLLPGKASVAPAPKRAAGDFDGTLLLLLALPLIADFALPISGFPSFVLNGVVALLAVPWVVMVLRGGGDASAHTHRARAWLFHLIVIGLMAGFLGAKWWLLLDAGRHQPELYVDSSRSYAVALYAVFALGILGRGLRVARFVSLVADHPARLMALSFGATGLFGAFILCLPVCVERVRDVSFVDNLFTAFSAVCVTGLAVNVIPLHYTQVGQAVILALVQVGGLGIMVLSAAVAVLAGRRFRVRSSAVLAQMVDSESLADLRRNVVMIVIYTLLIECAGALFLYYRFENHPEILARAGSPKAGAGSVAWAAAFHAITAFCNAGFSLAEANLVPFIADVPLIFCISLLIILGGIGFPVMDEITRRLFGYLRGRRPDRLSLHTRIVLRTNAILLVGVMVFYLATEWTGALAELDPVEAVTAAYFQSVSNRTAGFNVIDVGTMGSAALMVTCIAMFIGASPGSTGGGVKTTTLAALFATMRSELDGRPARLMDRQLASGVARKATGIAFLSLAIVSVGVLVLFLIEKHTPLSLAFEAVSAFSTTGLSTGITPSLSAPGKIVITLLMYVGRIGPLTIALALAAQPGGSRVSLPEERVAIG
jgi:trk system potassium uptake protein TrkH